MLERLEDRLLLAASVEEFPLRSTGGGVAGITSGVNGDPNLYFTMPSSNSIGVYNPETAGSVSEYPIPTVNANAQNLAVGDSGAGDLVAGSDGNIYFLESAANQIGVFSPTLDKVIAEYPILSSNNAGLQAITSGRDGNIWFTESNQNKISEFNIVTHQFTDFNVPTSLSNPYGITSDPADNAVWFTEANTNNIGEFNLLTHVFSEFNLGSTSLNPGNITYDATNGNVYFVETQTKSIGWLNAKNPGSGAQAVTGLKDTSALDHLTVDASGNIWATEYTASYFSSLNVSTKILTSYSFSSGFNAGVPEGIALGSDGQLWMAGAYGIQPFTTAGKLGTEVSGPTLTPGVPGVVVTDANGNLWFADTPHAGGIVPQIESFSLSTQYSYDHALPSGSYWQVLGLALDSQNKQIYFTEIYNTGFGGNSPGKIGVINPTTGVVTDLTTLPSGSGPDGITYDAMNGGYLWFTDEGLNKIGYLNPGGNVAYINTTPVGESKPDSIVADASGNLWVSWYSSGTVDRFTPTGSGSWLSKPISLGNGTNSAPSSLTFGPDGNIWVAETGTNGVNGQVEVINPSTLAIIKTIAIGNDGSITSRPEDNSVWIAAPSSVVAIATGTYTETSYPVPTTMGGPVSVVANRTDHNVYFTESGPGNGWGGTTAPYDIGAITLNPASQPDHLAITTPPPANVTKGVGFGLVVGVETSNNTLDGFLNTIDGPSQSVYPFGGFVTITLGANPNGATLGGTLTEPVNNGVAVFSGLTLDKPGAGEVLNISYSGLSSISSSPMTVALAASKLAVATQPPATIGAGQAFAVAFEAVDSNGNLDTSYNGPISVTTGVNTTGATLGGITLLGATNGIATFSTLTLNKQGQGYTIQGSDPNGVLSPISSSAFTVTSGPPASIAPTGGTPQSATVGTTFGTAFQALVEDQSGDPVPNVSVIFTVQANGASGNFAGSSSITVQTNNSGVAIAPAFTANTMAGGFSVIATVASVSTGATFVLTNTPDVPASIVVSAGNSQSAIVGTAFGAALQATVKDQYGNLVSGANVTFTAPASGAGGGFSGIGTAMVATNSVGVATAPAFAANTISGGYTVTAKVAEVSTPANFTLTNTPGPASSIAVSAGDSQSAVVGTVFTTTLQATVKDQYGNLVSGASVTFTLPASGASGLFSGATTVLTNALGVATESTFTANKIAGSYTVTAKVYGVSTGATFSLTNTPGPASNITVSSGNGQTAQINTAFAAPLQATVEDQYGNPVSGASVTFTASPAANGASGAFAGSSSTLVQTNASGVALALTFTADSITGSFTVTATVSGVSSNASFNLTNAYTPPPPPASVTVSSGTSQSAMVGTAFANALQATVLDTNGKPVSGVNVTFAAPASGASGYFAGSPTMVVTTNALGVAMAPAFTANTVAGPYTVIATVAGLSTPASFSLTNTPGPASSITTSQGNSQSALVAKTFTTPLQATVEDQYGNLVSGASVTFVAPASGASGAFSGSTTVTTNSLGVATAPAFTANTVAGSYTVIATVEGVSGGASFSLTNTPDVASSIVASAGTLQNTVVATTFTTPLQATVKDQYGNLISGASVVFTAPASGAGGAGGGFAAGNTVTVQTDLSGVATAPAFTANTVEGGYNVTATVASVSGGASFSLTNTPDVASSIVASAGTLQNTVVATTFTTPLQATVKDQYGNLISGASVVFTAPASGAGGGFAAGNTVTVQTDLSGVATAPAFTANATLGTYNVQAAVVEVSTPANFILKNTDNPVNDFLGTGLSQPAVYRPSTAAWYVQSPSGTTQTLTTFGWIGHDIPVPGDYDGVGHTEEAVFRPSTDQWFVLQSNGTTETLPNFGWAGHDVPAPGDYDGVGHTEQAVYRPSTGQWFVREPNGTTKVLATFGWIGHDIPVPGDYDGVGHTQLAVYRPSTAQWFVLEANGTTEVLGAFGWAGHDIPTPGDYDGLGHTEQAVYRPSTGQWFVLEPNGKTKTLATFGWSGHDLPVNAPLDSLLQTGFISGIQASSVTAGSTALSLPTATSASETPISAAAFTTSQSVVSAKNKLPSGPLASSLHMLRGRTRVIQAKEPKTTRLLHS